MLHKEGTQSIIIVSLLTVFISVMSFYFFPHTIFIFATILCIILLILILQFFRNPERKIKTSNDKFVYAPADGKIVVIEESLEKEYFKENKKMISIFMSPINVHVNRAPISGEVTYTQYHSGKYLAAWNPKSSDENERSTLVIKGNYGEILLRQIAGALARRIVTYPKKGDHLNQGQDYGFIKLGSRVDIFLPLSAEITVKMNEVVKGNINVIAKLN